MDQKSYFGAVQYLDFSKSRLCEPSMLFLLGLEAATTPSIEYSTIQNRSSYILFRRNTIPEVFDNTYFYLYGRQANKSIHEILYNCDSIKRQLNTITGTSINRICPIIYHESNSKDFTLDIDDQIEELFNILDCAGYCKRNNEIKYIGTFGIDDKETLDEIAEKNRQLKERHEKKKLYSDKYKQIDYKAMYSYALGVLYGCTCLGYDNEIVFKIDPLTWYRGEYINLIKTAFKIFNFYYNYYICKTDGDTHLKRKYHSIQLNKIWNFSDGLDYTMDDERLYYYDGDWRPFPELHDEYGVTLTPSVPITLYDTDLNEYPGWVDTSNNTTWIIQDKKWYDDTNIPYWKKLSPVDMYLIDSNFNPNEYSLRQNKTYNYDGHLQSFQYLHLNLGITRTPSQIYSTNGGIVTCWYNPDIDRYWDVATVKWYKNPPESGAEFGGMNSICSFGLFLYTNNSSVRTPYGALVDGSTLKPISISFPESGSLSYTKFSSKLTGSWRILTETNSSFGNDSIVFATKVSDQATEEETTTETTESSKGKGYTEVVFYNI